MAVGITEDDYESSLRGLAAERLGECVLVWAGRIFGSARSSITRAGPSKRTSPLDADGTASRVESRCRIRVDDLRRGPCGHGLHAARGLREAVERQPAVPHSVRERLAHTLDRLVRGVVSEAQGVRARGDRPDCTLLDPDGVRQPRISSASVTNESVESELVAEEVRQQPPADRRGLLAVGRDDDVGRHDRLDAGVDRGPEGQQRGAEVSLRPWQLVVRVLRRVAVSP